MCDVVLMKYPAAHAELESTVREPEISTWIQQLDAAGDQPLNFRSAIRLRLSQRIRSAEAVVRACNIVNDDKIYIEDALQCKHLLNMGFGIEADSEKLSTRREFQAYLCKRIALSDALPDESEEKHSLLSEALGSSLAAVEAFPRARLYKYFSDYLCIYGTRIGDHDAIYTSDLLYSTHYAWPFAKRLVSLQQDLNYKYSFADKGLLWDNLCPSAKAGFDDELTKMLENTRKFPSEMASGWLAKYPLLSDCVAGLCILIREYRFNIERVRGWCQVCELEFDEMRSGAVPALWTLIHLAHQLDEIDAGSRSAKSSTSADAIHADLISKCWDVCLHPDLYQTSMGVLKNVYHGVINRPLAPLQEESHSGATVATDAKRLVWGGLLSRADTGFGSDS